MKINLILILLALILFISCRSINNDNAFEKKTLTYLRTGRLLEILPALTKIKATGLKILIRVY